MCTVENMVVSFIDVRSRFSIDQFIFRSSKTKLKKYTLFRFFMDCKIFLVFWVVHTTGHITCYLVYQ